MRVKSEIVKLLASYSNLGTARFHAPGHKGKRKANGKISKSDIAYIPQADRTYDSSGIIKYTESKIAGVLGADRSYVFSDGVKSAVFAAVYSLKGLGTHVLIARGVNPVIYEACRVAGLEPLPINVPYNDKNSTNPNKVSFENLNFLYETTAHYNSGFDLANPKLRVAAVIVPAVDAYGFGVKLEDLENRFLGRLPIIVDNTYGTYLKFPSQTRAYYPDEWATAWIDCPAYSLGALTGAAILSVKVRERNETERKFAFALEEAINLFRCDKPSFPVLASLDYAISPYVKKNRKCAEKRRQKRVDRKYNKHKKRVDKIKEQAKNYGFNVYDQRSSAWFCDHTKLVIDCQNSNLRKYVKPSRRINNVQELNNAQNQVAATAEQVSVATSAKGFNIDRAEKILQNKKVYCEMNDGRCLVFSTTMYNSPSDYRKLKKAFIAINKDYIESPENAKPVYKPIIPTAKKGQATAFGFKAYAYIVASNQRAHEKVELVNAEGRVAAVNIGLYPSMYPLVVAGEVITGEMAAILDKLDISEVYGVTLETSIKGNTVKTVKVVMPSAADIDAQNRAKAAKEAALGQKYSQEHPATYVSAVFDASNPNAIKQVSNYLNAHNQALESMKNGNGASASVSDFDVNKLDNSSENAQLQSLFDKNDDKK